MINSILKVITGIVKIRGNTDDTVIGNVSDSLKVNVTASALPSNASTDRTLSSAPFATRLSDGSVFYDGRQIRVLTASDIVTANQGGTWNVNNISGSISLPSGASTSALQATGNNSLNSIDGKINSITTSPSSSDPGIVVRPVTVEYPTFSAASFDVVVGNNKSMLAIQNTGTSVVRIREIWIINDRTTAVTGVAGEFQVNRITSFTGGTAVTPIGYDSIDTLPSGISCSTGATVVGEDANSLRRGRWSTDEWGTGTTDVESFDHAIQQTEPFWRQTPNGKALTVRQNQGLHIKFATNSTAGAFTIRLIFTTE